MNGVREFPLQPSRDRAGKPLPGPLSVPWSVAEKAYGVYAARYGRSQSLERLAERGGFGVCEMDELYPPWRAEVDEINRLKAERDKLQRFKDWVHSYLDQKGVPHHPPGPHGAEGCRIGDRMDFVFAELEQLRRTSGMYTPEPK